MICLLDGGLSNQDLTRHLKNCSDKQTWGFFVNLRATQKISDHEIIKEFSSVGCPRPYVKKIFGTILSYS